MGVHFIRVKDTTSICQQFHDSKFMELQCIITNNVSGGNARLIPDILYIYKRISKICDKPSKRVVVYKAPGNDSNIYIVSGKRATCFFNMLGDQDELAHLMNEFSYEAILK